MLAGLFPYVCVIVVQFLLLYPLHTTMDLPIWDEAIYVGHGARFLHGDTLGAIFISPVYILLYSPLIKIFGSIHSVFYMQYLVKITVSTLLLLTLIEHLRSRSLALLLTLIWVASGVNIFERVLVYHVALGFFLLALFSLNKHRGITLLLLCLSSLTRLEYVFPTLAFAVLSDVHGCLEKQEQSIGICAPKDSYDFAGFCGFAHNHADRLRPNQC